MCDLNCRGCKFSSEEERLVIELQGQFGNRWAKIAKYLEGRTDNDVKNFWSSRKKKMERKYPRTPSPDSPPSKKHKSKGKAIPNQLKVEKVKLVDSFSLELYNFIRIVRILTSCFNLFCEFVI
jgi:myb proto-oncogene protein